MHLVYSEYYKMVTKLEQCHVICHLLTKFYSLFLDTVETIERHHCEQRGQRFSDSDMFVSHSCLKGQKASSTKGQLDKYKCSQCCDVFCQPSALQHRFEITHSGHDPKGPFACTEQGCQFSSTDRQEYQTHLTSEHSFTLIPCTYRSCKVSLLTQEDVERHLQGNMPFGCFPCPFVADNAKDPRDHLIEHNHLPTCTQGKHTRKMLWFYYQSSCALSQLDFILTYLHICS